MKTLQKKIQARIEKASDKLCVFEIKFAPDTGGPAETTRVNAYDTEDAHETFYANNPEGFDIISVKKISEARVQTAADEGRSDKSYANAIGDALVKKYPSVDVKYKTTTNKTEGAKAKAEVSVSLLFADYLKKNTDSQNQITHSLKFDIYDLSDQIFAAVEKANPDFKDGSMTTPDVDMAVAKEGVWMTLEVEVRAKKGK